MTPGTTLGTCEILSPLGVGGMGEVYRARDSRLHREVAIKVLPLLLRFEQEARAAAALNHPNILAVYQMGSYAGVPYLVSELLEGETLREILRRGPVPLRKAIDYENRNHIEASVYRWFNLEQLSFAAIARVLDDRRTRTR